MEIFGKQINEKQLAKEVDKVLKLLRKDEKSKSKKYFLTKFFYNILLSNPEATLTMRLSNKSTTRKQVTKEIKMRKDIGFDPAKGWWRASDIILLLQSIKHKKQLDDREISRQKKKLAKVKIFGRNLLLIKKYGKYEYFKINDDPIIFLCIFLTELEIRKNNFQIGEYYFKRNMSVLSLIVGKYLDEGWDHPNFMFGKSGQKINKETMDNVILNLAAILIKLHPELISTFYLDSKLFEKNIDIIRVQGVQAYNAQFKKRLAKKNISEVQSNKLITHCTLLTSISMGIPHMLYECAKERKLMKTNEYVLNPIIIEDKIVKEQKYLTQWSEFIMTALIRGIDLEIKEM